MKGETKGKATGRLAVDRDEWGDDDAKEDVISQVGSVAKRHEEAAGAPIMALKIGTKFYAVKRGINPLHDVEIAHRRLLIFKEMQWIRYDSLEDLMLELPKGTHDPR